WNGWFLITILREFAALAEERGRAELGQRWRGRIDQLREALEQHAWDGQWYLRAFFDNGEPLGSARNDECRIDSLPQAWAAVAGGAAREGVGQARARVEHWLVRQRERLILLFTPPFDQGPLQPGYIKGYVPGIRENGGQYTHAAVWVVQATALLGAGGRAVELFDLLNPVQHASSPEEVARYPGEPYVVAADVYSQPPHTRRGRRTGDHRPAGRL